MKSASRNVPIPPGIRRAAEALSRRKMITPALLFLVGHQPLSLVMGQLLYASAPFAALLGMEGWHEWATLLSDPAAPELLETTLNEYTLPDHGPKEYET